MNFTDEEQLSLLTAANNLLEQGKGILSSLDGIEQNLDKKLKEMRLNPTEEQKKSIMEALYTTEGINTKINGALLSPKTFNQRISTGETISQYMKKIGVYLGLIGGIYRVYENGKISIESRLAFLDENLYKAQYKDVSFIVLKTQFVVSLKEEINSQIIDYASGIITGASGRIQKHGKVPIIEIELQFDKSFPPDKVSSQQRTIFSSIIKFLNFDNVYMGGLIMKINILGTNDPKDKKGINRLASLDTFAMLLGCIPCQVPGVIIACNNFTTEDITKFLARLDEQKGTHTWKVSFSFEDSIIEPFLKVWNGKDKSIKTAQRLLQGLMCIDVADLRNK